VTSSTTEHFRQVIVDPRFAIESRDVVDFLGEFGPFNGRYVPRFPSDWASKLRKHVEDLAIKDPVKRQAMLERLRREAPLCTVPVGWRWEDELSWRSNVEQALPNDRKQLVVGDALDPEPFMSWVDALEDIRETRRRSWPFYGVIAEFVDACLPLLLHSPAAYLIDPYLDLFSESGEMLLRSLLGAAKGSRCYSLQVITRRGACRSKARDDNAPLMRDEEIESLLHRTYRNVLPKDRELKLHLVADAKPGEHALRMHDRFFLTVHGAINFGQGFFVLKQPLPQQNAYVLDRDHHIALKHTYIDGVARHEERLPRVLKIAYPRGVKSFTVPSE
jgi:hypothetical protein